MYLSRRRFIGTAGAAAGLAAVSPVFVLSGCGSSKDGSASASTTGATAGSTAAAAAATPDLGTLSLQLNWLNGLLFAPEYLIRAKGYDRQAGFTGNDLLVGGPSVPSVPVVLSGKARFGIEEPDSFAAALAEGASLKIIGVKYQTSPYTVISLASAPLTEPAQLKGKKIAVDDNNVTLLTNLLVANGLTADSVTMVPANFDVSLLSSGQVDGYVAYIPDEPVSLKIQGNDVVRLDVQDFGLASIGGLYFTTQKRIDTERAAVTAALRTFVRGAQAYLADAVGAIKLTNETMGADAP